MRKHQCPCCEYYSITEAYDICRVCGWEYDPIQHDKPDMYGGANRESLNEARVNYKKFGVSSESAISPALSSEHKQEK